MQRRKIEGRMEVGCRENTLGKSLYLNDINKVQPSGLEICPFSSDQSATKDLNSVHSDSAACDPYIWAYETAIG